MSKQNCEIEARQYTCNDWLECKQTFTIFSTFLLRWTLVAYVYFQLIEIQAYFVQNPGNHDVSLFSSLIS